MRNNNCENMAASGRVEPASLINGKKASTWFKWTANKYLQITVTETNANKLISDKFYDKLNYFLRHDTQNRD